MDRLFKQKLLSLRNPVPAKTFSEALLGDTSWLKSFVREGPKKSVLKPSFSEKNQVIESLERFAHEKIQGSSEQVVKVQGGGEILVRADSGWDDFQEFSSVDDLKENIKLDPQYIKISLQNKSPHSVKVIFVSEKFRSWQDVQTELKLGFINELLVGFPLKTAEFFERMILAMKLAPEEVIIFPIEAGDGTDYSQDVINLAAYFCPEVIITLGAKAANKVLKSNDRLSMIHGQFFNRQVTDNKKFQVIPLFHPSIIETNQNMKKTAWADMQKIMKFLKKIP